MIMRDSLKQDMQRHRIIKRTLADVKDLMNDPSLSNRVQYFGLDTLHRQAKILEVKLLVQVPDNFVQNLIDQTFLK